MSILTWSRFIPSPMLGANSDQRIYAPGLPLSLLERSPVNSLSSSMISRRDWRSGFKLSPLRRTELALLNLNKKSLNRALFYSYTFALSTENRFDLRGVWTNKKSPQHFCWGLKFEWITDTLHQSAGTLIFHLYPNKIPPQNTSR